MSIKLTLDGYHLGADVGRPDAPRTEKMVSDDDAQAILDAALDCPFCGSHNLTIGYWCLDDADVNSIECADCYAGAPLMSWQQRT